MERGSGVLLHITSLPGNYGIGTMGREALKFIDFLYNAKQRYWQVLPLGPTSYRDSPYQCFSSFAGNPYLIDLEYLVENGLLEEDVLKNADLRHNEDQVDYSKMFFHKMKLLKQAFIIGYEKYAEQIYKFSCEKVWLHDYSLFMALKTHFNYKPWRSWEDCIKFRSTEAINYYEETLKEEIQYWNFIQFFFYRQWIMVKEYANNRGIQIIGDIPFYVPEDSVENWVDGHLFLLDSNEDPIEVSGVPGDCFAEEGQLWGTPVYRWKAMEDEGFTWWINRIEGSLELFDVIRLDHFIGFYAYWSIPYGSLAKDGSWETGPGIKLFDAIESTLSKVTIIAEDLGPPISGINKLKEDTGYPGMNVLLFAFDSDSTNFYLPHNFIKNSVVYTGTHDNTTVVQWLETTCEERLHYAVNYLHLNHSEGYHWGFIRSAWSSISDVAIAPMQDILGLGGEARMNTPSTLEGNWKWRLSSHNYVEVTDQLRELTELYGRD